ncbi:MAG: zincin-like metallopeptidase domain-containing protein [Bryobacterales bacterium]|nr:zincin-like metallopeptidase domain-containing protein [Bryobacterales bacterium]
MKPLDSKGRDDYFRRVADVLIAQIKAGTAPWVQSWEAGERVNPYNLKTGKSYRGGNATWLASVSEMRGYQDERWGTYRQIQESGGQVRRGQKGASIIYWQWEARRLARDGEGKPVLDDKSQPVYEVAKLERPRSYMYTVFNAEQASGLPPRPLREGGHQWERNERVEQLIRNCGARVEHTNQDRVFYDLGRDLIVMPHREQFTSAAGYYQSALHELGHWTGHPERMNRESLVEGVQQGPKSLEYSREELRAEISSMITGDRLNVGHDGSRTAAYVDFWVKTLQDHPQEIYLASRDAQGISDYLMERGRMLEQVREEGVQDRQHGEPDRSEANVGPDLGMDREHPPIKIPRTQPRTPAWPDGKPQRDRDLVMAR